MYPFLYADQNNEIQGMAFRNFKLIQDVLKFRINVTRTKVGAFGAVRINRTYTNVLGLLQTRQQHLMLNNFMLLTSQQVLEFDLTTFWGVLSQHWVVPKAQPVPDWLAIFYAFNPIIWVLVFFSLIVLSVVWHYFGNDSLLESLELHFQILLESSNSKVLKITPLSSRVLACVAIFSFYVVSTAFRREMVRIFTSYLYQDQTNSLKGLVKKRIPCTVYGEIKELYQSKEEIFGDYVNNVCSTIVPNTDIADTFTRIASGENLATVLTKMTFKSLKNRMYLKGGKEPQVYLIPKAIKSEFIYSFLAKGHPFHQRFKIVTGRLVSSGITSWFRKQFQQSLEKELESKEIVNADDLSFEEVSAAIYILFAGFILGFVTFVLEVLTEKKIISRLKNTILQKIKFYRK